MNITLYEAAKELESVLDLIDDDGVIPDKTAAALAQFEGKGVSVAAYILNCEAQAQLIQEAAKKMQDRAKASKNRAESLKQYLKMNMQKTGITEISCPEFKVKLEIARDKSVEIYDANQLKKDYLRYKPAPPPEPDKVLIKKAIEDGFEVAGARIVKNDRLTFK